MEFDESVLQWKKTLFGYYKTTNYDLNLKVKSSSGLVDILYVNNNRAFGADRCRFEMDISDLYSTIKAYESNLKNQDCIEKISFIEQALKEYKSEIEQ